MQKLDKDFEDVKDSSEDFKDEYKSAIPASILDNHLHLKGKDFVHF